MFFGATVWPFRWRAPYGDVLPRIARLGFRGVELIAWNRDALDEHCTPTRIEELRAGLAYYGRIRAGEENVSD